MFLSMQKKDPIVSLLYESTEEGKKVTRNKGDKWPGIFRRIADPYLSTDWVFNLYLTWRHNGESTKDCCTATDGEKQQINMI